MNNKISLKNFAEVLSKELNISEEESEVFIKQLFETISAELKAGNEVYLDGIGTFSLTNEGSEPVEFTADKEFADAVNSQFAIFAPMQLDDDASDKELYTIVEPDNTDDRDSELIETDIIEQTPTVVIRKNEAPVLMPATDPIPMQSTEVVPFVESSQVIVPPVPLRDVQSAPEQPTNSSVHQVPVVPPPPTNETQSLNESETENNMEDYATQPRSKFGLGFFVGLIIGLAIGILALCAYILYFVNSTPGETDVIAQFVTSHCSKIL